MERALSIAFFFLICALGAAAQNVTTNCSSDPPPCGWNANCTDSDGGPICSCEAGYWLNDASECEVCPWGTWGWNCSYSCNCTTITDNSTTCNHVNGSCPEEDLYNCEDDPCGAALCRNVNKTFECYCPSGQRLVNGTCEECEWYTWGVECSGTCNCTDNTTTCNPVTGVCPEDEVNCDSNPCGAGAQCMDISPRGEYRCYCTNGSILVDGYWCMKCPAGSWGANCTQSCDCGADGNSCDNVDGECICNSCWEGLQCETAVSSDCVNDFLEVTDKCENNLKEMFGGVSYPTEPDDTLTGLAVDLMDLDNSVVIQSETLSFDDVNRENVGQGPLVQLTWRVDKNQDRPNAERGLDYLEELVKLGIVRGTLIVNSQQDYADVTINSGVRRCADEDEDV